MYSRKARELIKNPKTKQKNQHTKKEFYTVLDPKRTYDFEFFILFHLVTEKDKLILSRDVNLFTQVPHEKYSFIL